MKKIEIETNMISRYEIEEDKFFAMYWIDYEDYLEGEEDTEERRKKYITEWAWETVPYFGDDMEETFDDCEIDVTIHG